MITLKRNETEDEREDLDIGSARKVRDALERARDRGESVRLRLKNSDIESDIELPSALVTLLAQASRLMTEGKVASLTPIDSELTTRQAANILGVSRTYLIKLLDEGAIPYHRVGQHRRIRREDVLRYKAASRANRREALDQLAAESQEYGIGYD